MIDAPDVMFPNLGIEIMNQSRVAFTLFGFQVYWYGIIIGIAVLAGLLWGGYMEPRRAGQKPDYYVDFFFYVVPICVICARLYYVIFSWSEYKNDLLKIFMFREGGLAIYGAIIAAPLTAYVYCKIRKLNFRLFADTGVLGLLLGQAIGRWGNFINHEVFGDYTDSLFAMRYQIESVNASDLTQKILDNLVSYKEALYIQVHPAFLYESVWNILLFIALSIYRRHKKFDGEILALYLFGYGVGRFFIEGLRTDQLKFFGTGFPVSQLISILMIAGSTAFIIYGRKTLDKTAELSLK